MRWAGNVARIGGAENSARFWTGNLKQGGRLEDVDMDGRIILKWISRQYNLRVWTGIIFLSAGAVGRLL